MATATSQCKAYELVGEVVGKLDDAKWLAIEARALLAEDGNKSGVDRVTLLELVEAIDGLMPRLHALAMRDVATDGGQ